MANDFDLAPGLQGSGEDFDLAPGLQAQGKAAAIQGAMYSAQGKLPDRQAEILKLSQEMKLPSSFVESNFDDLKKTRELEKVRPDQLAIYNPKTADYLSNPDNAALAKDKINELRGVEDLTSEYDTMTKMWATLKGGLAKIGEGLARTPALMADQMIEWTKYGVGSHGIRFQAPILPSEEERRTEIKKLSDNAIATYFSDVSKKESEKVPELSQNGLDALMERRVFDAVRIFSYQLMHNAPNQALIIGSSILTRNPAIGLSYAGVSSAAQAHKEGLDSAATSSGRLANALISGTAEAAFESVGTFGILKHWEKKIAAQYGKQVSKQVVKEIGAGLAYSIAAEGNEEFWTSIAQDASKYHTGVDSKALDGMFNRAFNSAIIGAMSGGTMTSAMGMGAGYIEAKRAQTAKDTFIAIGDKLEQSGLMERLPEGHRQFVEAVTKDGPVENVYMSPETFNEYFQSRGANPDQIAQNLGITESLEQAKQTGEDVKIPMASLTTNLEREHFRGLANDVKFDPDSMTINEIKEEKSRLEAQMKDYSAPVSEQESASRPFTYIRDTIAQQLMDTGKFKTVRDAELSALPLARLLSVQAERTNQDPIKFLQKYFGGVAKGESQNVALPSVNRDQSGAVVYDQDQLALMKSQISEGEAGSRTSVVMDNGETKSVAIPSSFPSYFKDKGYKKQDVIKIIDKKISGDKLTDKQEAILTDLYESMIDAQSRGEFFQTKQGPQVSPLGFYSQLESEVSKMDFENIPAKDLLGRIKNLPGLKAEELDRTGIIDWLSGHQGKVSKNQVSQFIKQNGPVISQVVLADDYEGESKTGKSVQDLEWSEPERDHSNDSDDIHNEYEYYSSDDFWDKERLSELRAELVEDYTDENGDIDEEGLSDAIDKAKEERAWKLAEDYVDSEDYPSARYDVTESTTGWTLNGSNEMGWYSSEADKSFETSLEEAKVRLVEYMIAKGEIDGSLSDFIKPNHITWGSPTAVSLNKSAVTKRANKFLKENYQHYLAKAEESNSFAKDENGQLRDGYTKEEYDKYIKDDLERFSREDAEAYYADPKNENNRVKIKISHALISGRLIGNDISGYQIQIDDRDKTGSLVIDETFLGTSDEAKAKAIELMQREDLVGSDSPRQNTDEDINRPSGETKWKRYTVGGDIENYREILLTVPENRYGFVDPNSLTLSEDEIKYIYRNPKDPAGFVEILKSEGPESSARIRAAYKFRPVQESFYYTTHFSAENILTHIRLSDRKDESGKKVLIAEEFQSDWAQQGRERGFRDKENQDKIAALREVFAKYEDERDGRYEKINDLIKVYENDLLGILNQRAAEKTAEYEKVFAEYKKLADESSEIRENRIVAKENLRDFSNRVTDPIIKELNNLGFSSRTQAERAILENNDFAERWDIRDPEHIVAFKTLREYNASYKEADILFDNITSSTAEARGRADVIIFEANKITDLVINPLKRRRTSDFIERNGGDYQYVLGQISGYAYPLEAEIRAQRELYLKSQDLKDDIDSLKNAVPPSPFDKTESWSALALKRIMTMAAKEGYDSVGWFPAKVHIDRWGTDHVSWVRKDDHWLVGAVEQVGGQADGTNIEELARIRGELLERKGERVTTKDELRAVLIDVLNRERSDRSLGSLTESIWKQMQDHSTGIKKPREEGMTMFYDKLLPKVAQGILKKISKDLKLSVSSIDAGKDLDAPRIYEGPILNEEQINQIKETVLAEKSAVFRRQAEDVVEGLQQGRDFEDLMSEASPGLAEYFGGKLLEAPNKVVQALTLKITPEVRAEILKGFTLYQEKQDAPLGSVQFAENKAMVQLFEKADKSTFLHETGHIYLNVLADLATQDFATDQIKNDLASTLKFLGVDSVDQIKVEHHEKFARAFEAYLMEGKAPSDDLRSAFARFRVWLVSIYKHMTSLNVELSDDIRGVMDRLIATDNEIDRAYMSDDLQASFHTPETLGLSQSDFDHFMSARDEARLAAKEKLDAKMMADFEREKSSFMKDELARYVSLSTEEAYSMRVFRLLSFLKSGTSPDGTPSAIPQYKMNKKALVEMFNKELVASLPKGIYSEDGVHPSVVAEAFGYEFADDMIMELSQNSNMQEWIKAEAQRKFDEAYPGIEGEALEQETIKAIHNESRSKLLRMELEFLAKTNLPALKKIMKKVASRVPSEKDVRQTAQNIVNGKMVKELFGFSADGKRVNALSVQARRNEIKYANEAAKLLASGDIVGAFEAKRRELLNHELYRAAVEAEEYIDKAQKRWKKLNQSDEKLAKSRDLDYVNAARAILGHYVGDFVKKDPTAYLKALASYAPESFDAISSQIAAAIEQAGPVEGMSFNDLKFVNETIQSLWDMSKESKEMEIDGKKVTFDQAREEMTPILAEFTKEDLSGKHKKASNLEKALRFATGLKSSLMRVEHWAHSLGPSFVKYIYRPVKDATVKYRLDRVKYLKELSEILNPIRKELRSSKKYKIEALNYEFTKAELIGMLLHTGNESNMRKLLVGRGWGSINDDGTLDKTMFEHARAKMESDGILTKEDYDTVQKIWDLLEKMKPQAQKAHKQLYGFFFDEITANSFETRFGKYRGGYAPAVADKWLVQDQQRRADKEALEQQPFSTMFPQTGRGFTKGRIENYNVQLVMDLNFLPQHIDKVLRFANIQPAVTQVSKLLNGQEMRAALDAYDPTIVSEALIPFLVRAASQTTDIPATGWSGKGADSVLRYVRQSASLQIMAVNTVNALQNYTGLFLTAADVGSVHAARASWQYLRSPLEMVKNIAEVSDFMKTRITSDSVEVQREIHDLIANPSKFDVMKDFLQKNSRILSKMTQDHMEIIAWQAGYNKALESGMNHDQAVKEADSTVRRTQASMEAEDVSAAEVQGQLAKLLTMFFSYFNNWSNLLGYKATAVVREAGLRKGLGQLSGLYMLGFYLPATTAAIMAQGASGKWDDDDDGEYIDDILQLLLVSHLKTALAFAPGVGQAANAMIGGWTKAQYDDRISMSPGVQLVEKTVNIPRNIYRLTAEDRRPGPAVKDVLTGMGFITGLPLAPAGKALGYAADVESGFITSEGALDYSRGLMTGRGPTK